MQNKLLNTHGLTFEKACQIAKAMEMTEKKDHECRRATSNATDERQGMVNKVQSCYFCGGNQGV